MHSKQHCDKEDAAAAFETKPGLPSLICRAAYVAKAHLDMARYLAPILAEYDYIKSAFFFAFFVCKPNIFRGPSYM